MTSSRRAALLAGAFLACAAPAHAERPKATAIDAIAGITGAFADHPLVAVGEDHGDVAVHDLLRRLVSDPRFSRVVDDIVIEAGSARHQRVIDRFVAGKRVSRRALTATWRDSIGGGALGTWDAPIYEKFLRAIRQVNRERPADERLRVLLGDPPVEWEKVRTREQLHRWADQRDSHYATVVDEQVMRKGRRALLIAGMFHFHRDAKAPARSVLQHVEEKHPGKVFHVTLPTFDPAGDYGAAFDYARSFGAGSLVALDGTDLGALRPPRPPQAPQPPTEEENAEAWLIPDPARRGLSSNAYPTSFGDRWWKELQRRLALEGDMKVDDLFAEHCAYSTLQGRGLRQAVQPGAAPGEPDASAAGGGEAPAASDALDAILAQLKAGRTVAIGESRGLDQLHALVRKLIGSGRIPGRRPEIVVGFGNSRHQRVADRYVAGKPVSGAALARVWQDASQLLAYDSPAYEAFFKAVRDANRKLPAERRIRVLLGEPPLDWKRVGSASDVAAVVRRRAAFLAGLAMREDRSRSVIVIADRKLLSRVPGSATDRLPRNDVWVLQPYLGAKPLDAKAGSALTIAQSRLAKLQSGRNLSPSEPRRELGLTADALLYLGAPDSLTTHAPLPTRFRDAYVREIRRRHRLLYGTAFRPAAAFPTSECASPAETVGG